MFEGMSKFQAMKQTSKSTSKQIEMSVALNESCFQAMGLPNLFLPPCIVQKKKKKKKKKKK